MKRRFLALAAIASILLLVVACGGTTTQPTKSAAPEWVTKGSGAFGGEAGRVFYGVGSASNINNVSLLRSTADNRARNEISKIFQVYTASLMKDYMASTVANDPKATSEEQHVEQAIKTVSSATLSGVVIVEHYKDPETGEFFALARLDMDAFKDTMDKSKELDKKAKEYIRANADRLHDKLDAELEKQKQ